MKKVLSLVLAIVFVMGICASAPITITANAATEESKNLTETGEYSLALGGYTFTPTETGYYTFESTSGDEYDPYIYVTVGETEYENDDYDELEFKLCVYIEANSSAEFILSDWNEEVETVSFSITYEGTEKPEWVGDSDSDNDSDDDGESYIKDSTGAISARIISETECAIVGCDESALTNGVLVIPETIEGYTVTSIANYAFSDCSFLTSVTIPNSVTSIGYGAFSECTSLTTINLNEGLERIEWNAFFNCHSLNSLKIPTTVTSIDSDAFNGIEALNIICEKPCYAAIFAKNKNISYTLISNKAEDYLDFNLNDDGKSYSVTPKSATNPNTYYVESMFDLWENDTFTIPSTYNNLPVTVVKETYDWNVKKLVIPDTVQTIDRYAIAGSDKLEEVVIGSGVKTIGEGAFEYCSKLKSVTIPDNVASIGNSAFYECSALKTVNIGKGVEKIGGFAFGYSDSLLNITVSSENKHFCSIDNVLFNKDKTEILQYPVANTATAYNIPKTVVTIKAGAFEKSAYLISVNIPTSVKTIERAAFNDSDALTSIVIPDSVEVIGELAFRYCDKLEDITMSKNVKKIGFYAFHYTPWYENQMATANRVIYLGDFAYSSSYESGYNENDNGINLALKEGTRGVADDAFGGVRAKSITLPETLEYIGKNAFIIQYYGFEENCIKEITIPDSVKSIEECGIGYYVSGFGSGGHVGNPIPNFKIKGTSDSIAETYANENGFEFISNHTHNYTSTVTKEANCTTDGVKTFTCSCGDSYTETIKATGHKEVVIPAVAPTFTSVGKTEGKKCSVCGTVTVAQKDVAKLTLATPTVKIANSAKGISVTWNAIENAQSYIVYRRVYNASTKKWSGWSKLKTGVTATNYVDTTVKLGTNYRYTVRAVNGDVMSKYTSTSTLNYNVTPTVKIANASNGIKVSWSTAANATGYTVYRSQYDTKTKKWTSWKSRGTAKANVTSWTDKKVTSGVQYKYTVRAVYGSVKSSYKASVNLIYLAQPTVKIANNAKGVKVSWSKVTGATGYTVYRSEYKNGAWTKWASRGTAKANKSSWVDTKVTSGVQYKYTVRAINGKYKSTYKGTGGLLYLAQPTTTVKAVSNGINVAWTQCDGATGYTVYRMEYNANTKKWSGWKKMGTAKAEKSNWTDKSAKKGVTYKYTVRAVNGKTASTYKASSNVKR